MNQSERRLYLITSLIDEHPGYRVSDIPGDSQRQKLLLRGLMNTREPAPLNPEFARIQDEYLREETVRRGITDARNLDPIEPGICLWQGDITTLACDAIVNAANSGMTGCYIPNHKCIDNAIHTYAGIQLRLTCADIMAQQRRPEPTGHARITPAFNLPCRYVLHTVGPIVGYEVTPRDEELLASCYHSCLEVAAQNELESIAFCCISTGEFHFPNDRAAQIAIQAVRTFLTTSTSIEKVIFNVFKDEDKAIYSQLLGGGRTAR